MAYRNPVPTVDVIVEMEGGIVLIERANEPFGWDFEIVKLLTLCLLRAGKIVAVQKMPDPMPTNICFGGNGLRTAFITLSTTGKLVSMHWHEAGYRLPHS